MIKGEGREGYGMGLNFEVNFRFRLGFALFKTDIVMYMCKLKLRVLLGAVIMQWVYGLR